MNKIRKQVHCLCIAIVLLFCLAGCGSVHTYMTYTYSVNTGDSVDLKFDTTNGYQITSNIPFEISKDGEVLSTGTFIISDGYQMYVDAVNTDENAKVIETGSTDTCEYLMWNYNDSEYNYVIYIKNSSTGILIGNTVSEESAKEVFGRLQISIH